MIIPAVSDIKPIKLMLRIPQAIFLSPLPMFSLGPASALWKYIFGLYSELGVSCASRGMYASKAPYGQYLSVRGSSGFAPCFLELLKVSCTRPQPPGLLLKRNYFYIATLELPMLISVWQGSILFRVLFWIRLHCSPPLLAGHQHVERINQGSSVNRG